MLKLYRKGSMGMIDRYKKPGGFIQLLQLIETCGPKKQEQFLDLISEESEIWEKAIKQKMLTIERVLAWDLSILGEVLSRIPILNLAIVLVDIPAEKRRHYLSVFSQTEQRKIEEMIADQRPSSAEKTTYTNKFLAETRNLISLGLLKVERFQPELLIPDDFENSLENQNASSDIDSMDSKNIAASQAQQKSRDQSPSLYNDNMQNSQQGQALQVLKSTKINDPLRGSLQTIANQSLVKDSDLESMEDLKKKVNILTREIQSLKNENSLLKEKLEKIRKIA